MIEAIIFDMDGVIVDSEPIESLAWQKLLVEYGKIPEFNKEGLIHDVGISDKGFHRLVKKYNLKGDIEELKAKKRNYFKNLVVADLKLMPGFLKLAKTLKKENFKIALASNRIEELIQVILDKFNLEKYFNIVVGARDNINHKPAPDIFLQCAKDLGTPPKFCVAIEDSEIGVLAGKKARMKVIAVPNRYTKNHDFTQADKIVNSLSGITLSLLKSL